MEIETILLILEIIGTISFAVSGAFVAIKAKFDIFGMLFVFGVRMLATKYHWKLPKITLEDNHQEK